MYPQVDLFLLKSDGSPLLWNLAFSPNLVLVIFIPQHLCTLTLCTPHTPHSLTLTSLKKVAARNDLI